MVALLPSARATCLGVTRAVVDDHGGSLGGIHSVFCRFSRTLVIYSSCAPRPPCASRCCVWEKIVLLLHKAARRALRCKVPRRAFSSYHPKLPRVVSEVRFIFLRDKEKGEQSHAPPCAVYKERERERGRREATRKMRTVVGVLTPH